MGVQHEVLGHYPCSNPCMQRRFASGQDVRNRIRNEALLAKTCGDVDERQEIQGASRGGELAHIDRRSQLARRDVEIHQWLDARVLVEMKVLSKMDESHLR